MVYHQIPIGPFIPDCSGKKNPATQKILHKQFDCMIGDSQSSQQNIF